jgi:hypothetical protein
MRAQYGLRGEFRGGERSVKNITQATIIQRFYQLSYEYLLLLLEQRCLFYMCLQKLSCRRVDIIPYGVFHCHSRDLSFPVLYEILAHALQ